MLREHTLKEGKKKYAKYLQMDLAKLWVVIRDDNNGQYVRVDYYYETYRVIFKDEPNMIYNYGIKKKGKSVTQFCEKEAEGDVKGFETEITGQTKHSEEKCVSRYST